MVFYNDFLFLAIGSILLFPTVPIIILLTATAILSTALIFISTWFIIARVSSKFSFWTQFFFFFFFQFYFLLHFQGRYRFFFVHPFSRELQFRGFFQQRILINNQSLQIPLNSLCNFNINNFPFLLEKKYKKMKKLPL